MRLFDGEVRAASITACAAGPSFTTQASNFSLRRRSAAFSFTITASIPNCRKHSDRMAWLPSLRSTMAMRATTFLGWAMGARVLPRALSINEWANPRLQPYSGVRNMVWQRFLRPITRYKSVIQSHALTGYFGLSSEKEGKKSNAGGHKTLRPALEDQRAVGAAEAEGIRQGVVERRLAGLVGNEVHSVGIGILVLEIDRGRQYLLAQRQH